MTLLQQIQALARAFAVAKELSVGRVSTLVFGDGTKLKGILSGERDLTTRRYEKALDWFDRNWPIDEAWPAHIQRPSKAKSA